MDNALGPATLARGGVGAEVLQTRQVLKIRSLVISPGSPSSLLATQALLAAQACWRRN